MQTPLTDVLPPGARKYVYAALTLAGLCLGAYKAAQGDWLEFAGGLLSALGFGTAASNVSRIPDSRVQSYTDQTTPTGVVAGPAADLPTGTPVQPPRGADFNILGKA